MYASHCGSRVFEMNGGFLSASGENEMEEMWGWVVVLRGM